MHNFKKIFLSSISFVIIIVLISVIALYSFFSNECIPSQDKNFRNELSGKLDTLVIGASFGEVGIVPEIIDKKLGCFSYNLCGSAMSPKGKIAIIEEEIYRNNIDTIIINVGYDDLSYDGYYSNSEGDVYLIPRLSNVNKGIKFFFDDVYVKDYDILYSKYLNAGITYIKDKILGKYISPVDKKAKGWLKYNSVDVSLDTKKVETSKNKNRVVETINKESYNDLIKLVQLCKSNSKRVVLISTPYSESFVWSSVGLDKANYHFEKIARDNKCDFFDFNLIKERSKYFNDKKSFHNEGHLSCDGAVSFSTLLSNILKKYYLGEKVDNLFYNSYQEAKGYSQYNIKSR